MHDSFAASEKLRHSATRIKYFSCRNSISYSFSAILTETIFSFIKKYPKVKLNIFYKPMSELMDMLRDRKVDFVLAFKPSAPMEGIESHILFQNYRFGEHSHKIALPHEIQQYVGVVQFYACFKVEVIAFKNLVEHIAGLKPLGR